MRKQISIIFLIVMIGCGEAEQQSAAVVNGLLRPIALMDTAAVDFSQYAASLGKGIKHIEPKLDFYREFSKFETLLQFFKHETPPFEIGEQIVDRTSEEWRTKPALDAIFFPYLLDAVSYESAMSVVSPREGIEAFYEVYPIAQLSEKTDFYTIVYAVRYLDGNGQQDDFYLMTFDKKGRYLSGVEVAGLHASTESYLKTAVIEGQNYIKVYQASYNEGRKKWQNERVSQYVLDKAGRVYADFEHQSLEVGAGGERAAIIDRAAEFEQYFRTFQKAIKNNAPEKVFALVTLPHLNVFYEEHFETFYSKELFFERYSNIFNETLNKKILRQDPQAFLFENDEIGLSDGSIWFKRIGKDADGRLVVAIRVLN
jgi:hypothetical protein